MSADATTISMEHGQSVAAVPADRTTSPDLELSPSESLAILVNTARLQLEATRANGMLLTEILAELRNIREDIGYPLQRFVDSKA
jgi:hypothetical protein